MEKSGHKFTELVICGGLTKSRLFLQTHADVLGLPVIIPSCKEPVLLGAAISAAAAYNGADADDKNKDNFTLEDMLDKMAGGCSKIQADASEKT
jgi:ribulose kinase